MINRREFLRIAGLTAARPYVAASAQPAGNTRPLPSAQGEMIVVAENAGSR